jgi:threonine dehydrogenase-like Zn-dependent dehydrogenase
MKAVNYQGAFKVKVEDVPRPTIEHPDDVIVKVTTAGRVPGKGFRNGPSGAR